MSTPHPSSKKCGSNLSRRAFSRGSLALNYATTHEVSGLILADPFVKLSPLNQLKVDIGRLFLAWSNSPIREANPVKYSNHSVKVLVTAGDLGRKARKLMRTKGTNLQKTKIFISLSDSDTTIDSISSLQYILKHAMAKTNNNIKALDKESHVPKSIAKNKSITLIPAYDSKSIVVRSHMAGFISPSNPILGQSGSYRDCVHYARSSKYQSKFSDCWNSDSMLQGELTKHNFKKGDIRRITFNYNNQEMLRGIEKFFNF